MALRTLKRQYSQDDDSSLAPDPGRRFHACQALFTEEQFEEFYLHDEVCHRTVFLNVISVHDEIEVAIFFKEEVSGEALEKAVWGESKNLLEPLADGRMSLCPHFLLKDQNEKKN